MESSVTCRDCENNIWKQKLGRCKVCMWQTLFLLLVSAISWYYTMQLNPKSVASIALLMVFFLSAVWMLLHGVAFIYYYFSPPVNNTHDTDPHRTK